MPKAISLATGVSELAATNKKSLGSATSNIYAAWAKGLYYRMEVGIWLGVVKDNELWKQDKSFTSFKAFVENTFAALFDYKYATNLIRVGDFYQTLQERLKGRKDIPLPDSENQIRPLLTFDNYKAADLYEEAVRESQKTGERFTGEFVKQYVNLGVLNTKSDAPALNQPTTTESNGRSWSEEDDDVVDLDIDVQPLRHWSAGA